MSPRGRRASLPGDGPETSRGLLDGQDGLIVVRCFDEQEREHKDYRARGRADVTGVVRQAVLRGGAVHPLPGHAALAPARLADLAPAHLDGFYGSRSEFQSSVTELGALKRLLSRAEGLTGAMAGKVREAGPPGRRGEPRHSYSRDELRRIAEAARSDLRAAASRIRACREELRQVRSGELDHGGDRRLARRYELLVSDLRNGCPAQRADLGRAIFVETQTKACSRLRGLLVLVDGAVVSAILARQIVRGAGQPRPTANLR